MASTMVQVRNVPAELHRRLKARAALEGLSMSEFVLRELRKSLERPPRGEILERLRRQPARRLSRGAAQVLREERAGR